ncbi:site-specific integrase [Nonomuraea africana]|uniref:site-specific integrase n=1 Tax=Nonomuraea africana TaxID=46171 RepID=UPI0033E8E8B0
MDELATDADIVDEAGALALSAHTLRHTLATNLLRAGVDIAIVAELLGHARLDTTRRYTLPTHTDLEDDVSHLPTDQSGHR